jgi:hypothetical protein
MPNYRITFVCDEKWLEAFKKFTDVDVYENEVLYVANFEEIN